MLIWQQEVVLVEQNEKLTCPLCGSQKFKYEVRI